MRHIKTLPLVYFLCGVHLANAQSFAGSLLDAVRLTLQSNDGIAVSKQQLAASEGAVLSARAPFDTVWTAGVSQQQTYRPQVALAGGGDFLTRQQGYKAGVSRRLESGMVVNPTVSIDRIKDNGLNVTAPSNSNVAINFVIPLLKGRGSDINTAPVASAELSRDAARDSYRHALSQAVSRTATAYWDWVAAQQTLALSQQAEARALDSLAIARKLAAADEIPKADLLKYDVRRVTQEATRTRSAQQVLATGQALAQAMNVPLEVVVSSAVTNTNTVADPFPQAQDAKLGLLDNPTALMQLLNSSTEQRLDLRAAEHRLRASRLLADAGANNSSKQLDLNLSLGYSGISEGRSAVNAFSALGYAARGPNVGVTLNYALASSDFEKQGLVAQRDAAAEQARIEFEALRLRISADARTQLEALRSAVAQLEKASLQRSLQTRIYDNEKRSYQAGLSTLLELFTTESQLNAYQTEWVDAQRSFAQALVLFRFQTGLLLPGDQAGGSIQAVNLTALPEPPVPIQPSK